MHLIASLGGHLELLHAAAGVFAGDRRTWVTSPGARADQLAADGEVVRTLPRLDRGSLALRPVLAGAALALRERPSLVVSSGAGLAVPFALVSRLLGARLVFLETMARVSSPSATGRLFARLGADVLVQWPDLSRAYPGARVCAPTLLEGVRSEPDAPGEGTFVTVGSHDAPFERLLAGVQAALDADVLPRPVVVQTGVSPTLLRGAECVPFTSPDRFAAEVARARLVVTHGGAGAIAAALRHGRTPLVVPRRASAGEHVDDHQEQLVGRLAAMGLVVEGDGALDAAQVERATSGRPGAAVAATGLPTVAEALDELLRGDAAARRPGAP